jgi:LmbE family N-acetylglucosaminyl deacetylase
MRSTFATCILLLCSAMLHAQTNKVILAIFAHPDDEGTVSPVLAKYASAGATVYLAIATDGRYGVTEHAGIPAGDSLASVRVMEMRCAAERIGAKPPIMLGLHDQLQSREGFEAINRSFDSIRNAVTRLFTTLKPDVVITWGPSGWTSHPDHRLVGAIVSEVFSSKVWGKPSNLFYPELVTGSIPHGVLATVDSTYLPVRINVSEADYTRARTSHNCHKSQYTPEQAAALQQLAWNSQKGVVWFRPFIWKKGNQDSLFGE